MTGTVDVLVAGGGNAALCAAITARRAGASVLVVEAAPKFYRGGNTRHTRNMRCAHDTATEHLTGPYTEDEFWDDLLRVTEGNTDEQLARYMIGLSKPMLGWIAGQGVRFQPSLGGTLSLGRTNSFFLGGGRAMLNALYLTAERLGVDVLYDSPVVALDIDDGRFRSATLRTPEGDRVVRARALVAAAGGFESNFEWLKQGWGEIADNFLIRGTPYNRGDVLKMLMRSGVETIGDPTQCHAVAIDARAPKFDGGIITRLDCVVFGIVVNREAKRFYDEGEDFWPKRYAIWGRLVAQQPDQIAWIIFDSSSLHMFMPSLYPPIAAPSIGELAAKLSLPAGAEENGRRFQCRGAAGNVRPHVARRLPDRRAYAAEEPLGSPARDTAVLRLSGTARHHLHVSLHAGGSRCSHANARRRWRGESVCRRRDHGRQRARQGLHRRHRHDHRQRVRKNRRRGSSTPCTRLTATRKPRD